MRTPFTRLRDRVSKFGNHHRKYLHFIEAKQAEVIDRLEERGLREQIHLWNVAGKRFGTEMRLVRSVCESKKQKLDFLGWFYSTQFLLMNLRGIDILSLNLILGENTHFVYRQFMKQIGWEFRNLTAVYMENLLELFIKVEDQPELAVLGVGTRADQDDIDIGIIDDGSAKREGLNQAISQLQTEMMKHACRLHLYLSETIRTRSFSTSLKEYKAFLREKSYDYIVISEMLSAALIFGSKSLFSEFQKQITDRYYYHKNQNNKYHEGYLRGILGEIRALLGRRIHADTIHPKDDALRIIKSLAYAGKCICGIHRVNAWDILDALCQYRPRRKAEYQTLNEALSFFEIFRFLYQLYVVQEEEIYHHDEQDLARLDNVAQAMGYQPIGTRKASDFLLVHYYENIKKMRHVAEILLDDFSDHLGSITSFAKVFHSKKILKARELLEQFLKTIFFFQGTKFWNDLFVLLDKNNGAFLVKLVEGYLQLSKTDQILFCRELADAAKVSFYSFFSLLVLISDHKEKSGFQELFNRLNEEFLRVITEEQDRTWRIARIFNFNPRLVNNYIMSLTESDQKRFIALLEAGHLYTRQDIIVKDKIKYLGELYFNTSRYFRRYSLSVINKYPQFIEYVDDPEELRKFAKGFLGSVENETDFQTKKEKLHDSFYLDFFRIGITLLKGGSTNYIESEFTAFFSDYLQALFSIAKQEVTSELGEQILTGDLLGIFVSGSLGREHAFEDDLDLIVVLNSEDERVRKACTPIITRMNREIIRQGIITHYRFAEHFGHYITLVTELEDFFQRDITDNFIEKSQLLGARLLIGSTRFERRIKEQIYEPFIYARGKDFIQAMTIEIQERHQKLTSKTEFLESVKDGVGALRDIELILLMCKAFYHLDEPVNRKIIEHLQQYQPEYREKMIRLGESFDFLRHLRNVYRTVVAAKNTLDLAFLDRPAKIMGYHRCDKKTPAECLLAKYHQMCRQSTEVINFLLNEFAQKLKLEM